MKTSQTIKPPIGYVPLSSLLVEELLAAGVQEVFYLPGAHIDELLRAILDDGRLKCYMATNESGAAFMADGVCRMHGRPSAVLTIGGPGAGNMITAAMTAATDRMPVIFITGDAPSFLARYGSFQHTGPGGSMIRSIFEATGCRSFRIQDANTFKQAFCWLSQQETSWKQEPLHLSIPCDLANQLIPRSYKHEPDINVSSRQISIHERYPRGGHKKKITKAALWIGKDVEPSALISWQHITATYGIPVMATMDSAGKLADFADTLRLGVFGYAGHPEAHECLSDPELELLIIHGVTFNERNTGLWSSWIWHPDRWVIVIGSEETILYPVPLELSKTILPSVSAAINFIDDVLRQTEFHIAKEQRSLYPSTSFTRHHYVSDERLTNADDHSLTLSEVLQWLCNKIPAEMHVFTDSGDHRYFTSFIFSRKPHRYLHGASQTAPMGWAIGAGIGAGLSLTDTRSLVITGDGCTLMHGLETATAVRYQAPVTFLLVDNGSYGKISRRFTSIEHSDTDDPGLLVEVDWALFCRALAMPFSIVAHMQELMPAWETSMNTIGPFMIILKVSPYEPYPYPASVFSSTNASFIQDCQQNINSTGWPLKNIPS